MIDLQVLNLDEVQQGFQDSYTQMYMACAQQVQTEAAALLDAIRSQQTSGQMVQSRSGALNRNLDVQVQQSEDGITASVGITDLAATPYARILLEGGTTRAHVIEARNAQALAFVAGGSLFLRKKVQHPGSHFSARPFLAQGLEMQKETIMQNLENALNSAVAS